MNINIDDCLYIDDYKHIKKLYFDSVENGYNKKEVEKMRSIGISDDNIFLAEMLGAYKGLMEKGIVGKK